MKRSHSFNFLLELIIVIIFFMLSSIVFVGLFSSSYKMNKKASVVAEISMNIESMATEFRHTGEVKEYNGDDYCVEVDIDGDKCHLSGYDSDHNLIEEVDVIYLGVDYGKEE